MIARIKKILNKKAKPRTDFSDFFYNASSSDKKKLLVQVVKKANQDQKTLIEKYNKLQASNCLKFR